MVVVNGLTVHGCISDSGGSAMNKCLSNELIATVEGLIQCLLGKLLESFSLDAADYLHSSLITCADCK